ncbi:MAG: site-specific DNA-methyltransferase [Clostridia bacterium]|nr:site-specific DNA-methyltransferase [Clostridia bacterium]
MILDPFAGSQSLRVACHKLQRHYIGFELETDYYNQGVQWFNSEAAQISIFDM